MKNYFVVAYYYLTNIKNVQDEISSQKSFFKDKDVLGRIYISEKGVNGQVSCHKDYYNVLIKYLSEKYPKIIFKIDPSSEHAFCKMTVKYRQQLVALDIDVDLEDTGEHVSPEKWQQMLEDRDENTVLIDVRNDYEWEVGHFENAELPKCSTFREFPEYTKKLKDKLDPKKTKLMIYCTGGIRCEFYAPLLKAEGFDNIYQLEGGIINYGHQVGSKHWKGKVFVFDDRLTVPISNDQDKTISVCEFCKKSCSTYYNCANMDCNKLFLSCHDCAPLNKGCCSKGCHDNGRVRQFDQTTSPKPFRKLSFQEKYKISAS